MKLFWPFQMVQGSGPEGRIQAEDVESFVPGAAPSPAVSAIRMPTPATPGAAFTDIPLTNIRKVCLPATSLGKICEISMHFQK